MGESRALRLLRSCLFFSGRKRSKKTIQANDLGGDDGALVSHSLPEDIIFDVLTRLTVKTLCRLRCVSKGWRALISDPAFAAAQGSRAATVAPLVVGVFGKPCPREKFYPVWPPRFPDASLELRVIDTADGSVLRVVKDVKSKKLLRTRLDLVFIDRGEHGAKVIDPVTGRLLALSKEPLHQYPVATNYKGTSNIATPMVPCHSSFGRATPSGTYKVLRLRDVFMVNSPSVQICHIATLDDDISTEPTWRQRPEPPILTCRCSDCTAHVNGVLHFMGRGTGTPTFHVTHGMRPGPLGWDRIASFDLESEEWTTTIGPPVGEEEGFEMVLTELKGTLSMVQIIGPLHRDRYINIWFLLDPEKSIWVKEHTIHMPKIWRYFRPLEILGDGRILMLNSFKEDDEDFFDAPCILQFYDPSTGALTNLMEMSEDFKGPLTVYPRNLLSQ